MYVQDITRAPALCSVIARGFPSLEYPCNVWDRAHHSWHLPVIIQQLLLMRQKSGPRQLITGPLQQQGSGYGRKLRSTKLFTEKELRLIRYTVGAGKCSDLDW